MSSDHVLWWRLILEEYGPKMFYIPGPNNVVDKGLRRLPTMDEILTRNILPMTYLKSTHVQKTSIMNVRKMST